MRCISTIPLQAAECCRDYCLVNKQYEEVYLHAYGNVPEARAAIGKYLAFYNTKRPHSSLDRKTSDQAYVNTLQQIPVAA